MDEVYDNIHKPLVIRFRYDVGGIDLTFHPNRCDHAPAPIEMTRLVIAIVIPITPQIVKPTNDPVHGNQFHPFGNIKE